MTIIPEHTLGAVSSTNAVQDSHKAPHSSAQNFVQVAETVQVEVVPEINHPAPYCSDELASELGIAESTLRTRWFSWLQKVAPVELLTMEGGYTELARSLFSEFAQLPSKKKAREQWVSEAKQRYSREFMPSGVTPDGVPNELGGALALLQSQGNALQSAADAQLLELQALISQQAQMEAEFDAAEIAAMRAAGAKRGVMRFQIETQEEDAAYYQLRKLKTQARQQSPQGKS